MRCSTTLVATAALSVASSALAQDDAAFFTTGTVDEHIDYPASPFTVPEDEITIEAWVTYDDATVPTGAGYYPTILRHTDTPGGESYFLRVQAGSTGARVLRFVKKTPGGGNQALDYGFAPGEFASWTHLAATFNGNTARLLVNGAVVASTAMAPGIADGGGTLRIGNGDIQTAGNEVWNGAIDEVRIWPFARTAAAISEDKDKSLSGLPGALTFPLDNFTIDTSQGLIGTPTAGVTYVPGAGTTVASFGCVASGYSTTNCVDDGMLATVGSTARAGNTAFDFICADASPGVTGAILLTAFPSGSPLTFLGVDFFIDFGSFIADVPATTNNAGKARIPVPLPASTEIGLQFSGQFLFIDTCGSQGLTSSNLIDVTILP